VYRQVSALVLATGSLLAACSEPDPLREALAVIKARLEGGNAGNEVQYAFSFDPAFPCAATLDERWQQDGESWHHRYRFDIHAIERGTFLTGRDGRRSITYDGERVTADGETLSFAPKQIGDVHYRAALSDADQVTVLQAMADAMAVCEEKYEF
jgi:hypothetical protein